MTESNAVTGFHMRKVKFCMSLLSKMT